MPEASDVGTKTHVPTEPSTDTQGDKATALDTKPLIRGDKAVTAIPPSPSNTENTTEATQTPARLAEIRAQLHDPLDTRPTGDIGMMQDALANNPDLAREMADRAEIRRKRQEYWGKEYIKGNVTVPQTSTGIQLYMLNAVLQEMNTKNRLDIWEEFAHSRLTPEQRKELGRVMSAVHHAKGIKVATKEHQKTYDQEPETPKQEGKTHDRVIPPEAFDQLWTDTIAGTKNDLVQLAFFAQTGKTTTPADITPEQKDEKIAEFLKNPAYEQKIQEFTNMVAQGVKLLEAPEGKKLTFAYRKSLDYSYVPDQILYAKPPSELGYTEADTEFAQLQATYEELQKQHPRQTSQGEPREQIISYLRDDLGKAYPDFNKEETGAIDK